MIKPRSLAVNNVALLDPLSSVQFSQFSRVLPYLLFSSVRFGSYHYMMLVGIWLDILSSVFDLDFIWYYFFLRSLFQSSYHSTFTPFLFSSYHSLLPFFRSERKNQTNDMRCHAVKRANAGSKRSRGQGPPDFELHLLALQYELRGLFHSKPDAIFAVDRYLHNSVICHVSMLYRLRPDYTGRK